jgi:hypothetical protein
MREEKERDLMVIEYYPRYLVTWPAKYVFSRGKEEAGRPSIRLAAAFRLPSRLTPPKAWP